MISERRLPRVFEILVRLSYLIKEFLGSESLAQACGQAGQESVFYTQIPSKRLRIHRFFPYQATSIGISVFLSQEGQDFKTPMYLLLHRPKKAISGANSAMMTVFEPRQARCRTGHRWPVLRSKKRSCPAWSKISVLCQDSHHTGPHLKLTEMLMMIFANCIVQRSTHKCVLSIHI
jgi:hypothetical protein